MNEEELKLRARARLRLKERQAVPRTPEFEQQAAGMLNAPSPLERLGAGVADVKEGIQQKYLNWTDPAAAQTFTAQKNEERAALEKGRQGAASYEGQNKPGFDWFRAGGTASAMAPLALIPGGKGLAARGVIGALQGGGAGYGLFNPDNTAESNALRTGVGAAAGGLTNALAPWVLGKGMQAGQWAGNKARQGFNAARSAVTPQTSITNNIRVQLRSAGVDFDALSTGAQKAVRDEATRQLRSGHGLNAEQLMRNADIESVVGPGSATRAQITRSPQDWSIERNLQKTEVNLPSVKTGSQETITSRLQMQDSAMKTRAGQIADDVYGETLYGGTPRAGTSAGSQLEASSRAMNAVRAADKGRKQAVDNLYRAYRDSGMKDTKLGESHITKELTEIIDDYGLDNVPPAVTNRLKELAFLGGDRTRYLTIKEADAFNRLLNNNDPGFGPASAVIQKLKGGLTRELLDVPGDAAQGASAQLLTARKAAADMFAKREAGRAVASAIKDVAPDKFLQQNVLGGSVRDLQKLKTELSSGPDSGSWNDLRSQAWQSIVDKVTQGGRAPFSGARLDNELNKLGRERLQTLFTRPEIQQIEQLRRASLDMTYQPPFSAVNASNTSPAMLGQLMRLGNKVPFANMVTKPLTEELEMSATQGLLNTALAGRQAVSSAAREQAQAAARNAAIQRMLQERGIGGLLGVAPGAGYMEQGGR